MEELQLIEDARWTRSDVDFLDGDILGPSAWLRLGRVTSVSIPFKRWGRPLDVFLLIKVPVVDILVILEILRLVNCRERA